MAEERNVRAERLLAAWRNIARHVAESRALAELGPQALEVAGLAEGWRLATLWWVDPDGARLRRQTSWYAPGISEQLATESRPIELAHGEGLAGCAWRDGTRIATLDVVAHPIRIGDEVLGVIEVTRDVDPPEAMLETVEYLGWELASFAQRVRLEGALRHDSEEQARSMEMDRLASLGSLAGAVAHEINNALTYVWLSLGRLITHELSRRPLTPVRFHRIELLQDVREGFTRVERVVRELKEFSRVDDGPKGPLDVPDLIRSVVPMIDRELAPRAKLVIEGGDVPPVVARPGALRQVFLNLLLNAAQSIPEGRAEDNEIRVVTRTDSAHRVIVEVKDTGQGIDPRLMSRIFDPFVTTRGPGRGIGLGLSVCRDIVTSLGGEIVAESAPNYGTVVRVVLPAAGERSPSAGPRQTKSSTRIRAASPGVPSPSRTARVLIVDDDRPVAAAIALELAHYDVVVAEGGREALDILRHDKDFDVVFCDLMMPNVTGMDLYETLKKECPDLVERFVFMTGGAFTTRSRVFLATVPNERIDKPFGSEVLDAIVQRFVQRGGRSSSARA